MLDAEDGAMGQALRTGKAQHDRAAVFERQDGSRVFVVVDVEPLFGDEGTLLGAIGCFHEAHGLIERKQDAGDIERHPRALLDALPTAIYTTDAKGRLTYFNEAAADLWGRRPALGSEQWCGSWRLYWSDGRVMSHDECPMAVALKTGKPVRGYEAIAEKPDGSRVPFIPYPTPIISDTGEVIGAVNMLVDISDRKRAEDRHRALLDELNHRVKNSLATVQSIAMHTLRGTRMTKAALAAFDARLIAFSRAHDLLTREKWQSTDLASIMQAAIAPYPDTAIRSTMHGPRVHLTPRTALMMALVIHELASNAAKHGALSSPEGLLDIEWRLEQVEERPLLCLDWRERGGPEVSKPRRRGFGLTLIERSVRHEMGGAVEVDFAKTGFTCGIRLVLD
jgi:PAS domain S-box-containing protein